MPIYSETISDENILRILRNKYHRILLIGCGACMNESLAYKYDKPICKDFSDVPYATVSELDRIAKMLEASGYEVETKHYNDIDGFFCMTDIAIDMYPIDKFHSPDVIMILSCDAGCLALRDRLPEAKVIKIANQIGYISYGYIDMAGQRIIVKGESAILPLARGEEK